MIRHRVAMIKQIKKDIRQMKNVKELIDYIPLQLIEKLSFLLLTIWILTPVIILIQAMFINDGGPLGLFFIQSTLAITWYTMLQQIGYIGCFLGIIVSAKSILRSKAENVSIRQYLLDNLFPVFLFLMLLWSTLSYLASDNMALSFKGDSYRNDGLRTYIAYCGIFCCGYALRDKQRVQRIFKYFTAVATFLSLLVLIDSDAINHFFKLTENASVFRNINHFGYYICLSLMCALLLFVTGKGSIYKQLFRLTPFIVMTAALVQNRSFGPYIAVIFGLICGIILTKWQRKSELKRVLFAAAIFLMVSLFMNFFINQLFNEFQILAGDTGNIVKGSSDANQAGSGRWPLWVNGLRFIAERPLFGYGPDNLGSRYAEIGLMHDRPHNEIIQFAASLGIPAAIFYISALAVHFISLIKSRKLLSMTMIGTICGLVTYLISSLFGNTMFYTTPFFFMILGLSGGMYKSVVTEQVIRVNP